MHAIRRKLLHTIAWALPTVVSLGCADKPAPNTAAQPPAPARTTASPPAASNSPTASAVKVSAELAKLCGLSEADAFFPFDSSDLAASNTRLLDGVAACSAAGKLKGRVLQLVGHADPRGTNEYNMTLGQARADAVLGYLAQKGVARPALQSSTRGELDAAGKDEPGWVRDRRVDVTLAN